MFNGFLIRNLEFFTIPYNLALKNHIILAKNDTFSDKDHIFMMSSKFVEV